MGDLFKKTVVVCAAASSFGGGAYITTSGLDSIVDSKVATIVAKAQPVAVQLPAVDANARQ